ncbi:MAG: sulfatase-like hydrolase/transferase, partial [candidate division Zixibacteria bacterium]|nr:sulfatase-like hydrolase/transferase [candidate division Zixibacteria bacterium]
AYVANPTCMPNRCSIMTGQYPNMCVRTFGVNLPEDIPTFPDVLRQSGYNTKAIGKMHLQYWNQRFIKSFSHEYIPAWASEKYHESMVKNFPKPFYGFDEVDLVVGHGDVCFGHYTDWVEERFPECIPIIKKEARNILQDPYRDAKIPEEAYSTTYITEKSIEFLEKQGENKDEPFLLYVSYPDPHHPCTPPGKYGEMYKPEDMPLPENFNDIENLKKHDYIGQRLDHPIMKTMMMRSATKEDAQNFTANTYGMISMIDDSVGQILAALEKLGMADNTMIVYTSDHGDMMGEHGLILKGLLPYNGILQVPLIWKVPGMENNGISDSLVSAVDLAPTILNLLDINKEDQPEAMQGVDITPVLKDPTTKVRDCCLIEIDEADSGSAYTNHPVFKDAGNMELRLKYLITDRYSLTIYNGLLGYGDLFDRQEDPHELNNLWFSKPELRHELVEKLLHEVINAQSLYPVKQAMA